MIKQAIPTHWAKLSLASKILIGLGLGILTGLFFGEPSAVLQVVANAYIRLMQMTVIPYVAVALIAGLGQLDLYQARVLALRGGTLLLIFWAISFVIIFLMPLTFPEWHSGSFFSNTLVEPRKSFDFAELYIPANPFHALANSIVPAVVLFSAAVGIALIGIENKATLIDGLQIFLRALSRVTKFVVELTPLGVFAIGAVAAGTMTMEDFARLQVYFVVFIAAALLLTFWILPALIATVTPFKYKDILGVSKDALLTAFVTHNLFIVIPILIEHSKRLMEKYQVQTTDSDSLVEVIIPVTFNFPTIGKLLSLLFVPFAAWLAGSPLELHRYPGFFLTGVITYFAKAQTALPFLMDQLEIPQDLFQLYIPTAIINGKFDTLLAAMNLLAFSVIGTGALTGYLSIKPGKILRYLITTALALVVTVVGTGFFLGAVVDTTYRKDKALRQMKLLYQPVAMTLHKDRSSRAAVSEEQPVLTLAKIKERGVLTVGYDADRFPFTFLDDAGNLVGFDVDMANLLARDLGVRLEFVPATRESLSEELRKGTFDVMPSIPYLPHFLTGMELSAPYIKGTAAFVMEDHRRHDFATLESIQRLPQLSVGVLLTPETVEETLKEYLPDARINLVFLDSPWDFFEKKLSGIDALLASAEVGTAWTLLYPEYVVVVPKPRFWRGPMGFAVAKGNLEFSEFLDKWVAAHEARGSIQRAYNHWILGQGAEQKGQRWSIIRNVLNWID
jgi:Na+/H+-dicarboxylate symporter/ABC-type amino acid transport substrate-binding protein